MITKQTLYAIARLAGHAARTSLWACLLVASAQALAGSDDKQGTRYKRHATPLSANAEAAYAVRREKFSGEEMGEILKRQFRWLYSIPYGVNPVNPDEDGSNCGINQEGAVWFLAAPADSGNFTRSCVIPYGKAIVTPVFASLDTWPCPDPTFVPQTGSLESFLRQDIGSFIDEVQGPAAALNGKALKVRRMATDLFGLTGAASLITWDSCVTGSPQLGVGDGYWVLIDPLPRGKYTLVLQASNPSFFGTFTLHVR
jgi:hypothetical protein